MTYCVIPKQTLILRNRYYDLLCNTKANSYFAKLKFMALAKRLLLIYLAHVQPSSLRENPPLFSHSPIRKWNVLNCMCCLAAVFYSRRVIELVI